MSVWAKWFAWAVWGEGGAAAAPTYTISGTINDSAGAGFDGVTVTLSGDASDSVVTAGGGAYEFTGLAPGSYTLTPTKAGSTFLPASANVTIVGANKTATTMAQVWQITGTILDSAAAAVSGVLVTLSGDASDTDTTDGSGNYSFPGLSDGSYTVTPTNNTNRAALPSANNETVTGADVTGSDFIEYFKYLRDFNDETIGQAPAGDVTLFSVGTSMLVQSWEDGESENWNPAGFSKCLDIVFNTPAGNKNYSALFDVGETIPVDITLNIEGLMTITESSGDPYRGWPLSEIADSGGVKRFISWNDAINGDYFLSVDDGSMTTLTDNTVPTTQELKYWIKFRGTINFTGATASGSMIRPSGPTTRGSVSGDLSAGWPLGVDATHMLVGYIQADIPAAGTVHIARAYVGDAALGWPSDS